MARIPGTKIHALPVASIVTLVACFIFCLVLSPSAATASDGQFLVSGAFNTSESQTTLNRTLPGAGAALAVSAVGSLGIDANSSDDAGVRGSTGSRSDVHAGVEGYGFQGVWGEGELAGVFGMNRGEGIGVFGEAHADDHPAIEGLNVRSGVGVLGTSVGGGDGVDGLTASPTSSGVFGNNGGDGPGVKGQNLANGNGVFGFANNATASGVYGQNDGTGFGVAGRSNTGVGLFGDSASGTAVSANSPSGVALSVTGAIVTNRAGLATITAGTKSVKQSVANVSATSLVLALLQGPKGKIWVTSATVTPGVHGFITIYLNGAPSTNVQVAWFVLN